MIEYKVGETYLFSESGTYAFVLLLAHKTIPNGDEGDLMDCFKLQVKTILLSNPGFEFLHKNETIDVSKSRKSGHMAGWHLDTKENARNLFPKELLGLE